MFGRDMRLPIDVAAGLPVESPLNIHEYALKLKSSLTDCHNIMRVHSKKMFDSTKLYYDKKVHRKEYALGDKVMVYYPKGQSKLKIFWKGPFTVIEKKSDVLYKVRGERKQFWVHIERTKPFVERTQYAKREAEIENGNTAEYKSFLESSQQTFEKQPETNGRPKRCCVKPVDYGIFFVEDQVHKREGRSVGG
ncbi:hypothetical protein RF11_13909 [Thelohanellus kitauei]|uniref:Integrase p58-like C-terminal domain-containing protein n=1 Tax=Thelohanellus kitauei TaxID=669202 RepID=A0A0C2MGY0_THEKT|nr:hypothetical protein RF11_13909 [Thelohanellus kitauei]